MTVSVEHPTDRPNFYIVSTPVARIGFSYTTAVAVYPYLDEVKEPTPNGLVWKGYRWWVSRNLWGPTTGKHLNYFDGGEKGERVNLEDIDAIIAACFKEGIHG